MAVPGSYTARLHAADGMLTQSLRVQIDPRVEADGTSLDDLELQFRHNLRVRDLLSEAREALERVNTLRAQANSEEVAERLRELYEVLMPPEDIGVYPPRRLLQQANYLYSATTRADQHPGDDALDRYEELREELDRLLEELRRLETRVAQVGAR